MSMNLACDQVELYQTPTYITYMCYSNNNGGWKGIKYRYIQWFESRLNGVYESLEEIDELEKQIKEHVDKLNSFKKLDFYII